MLEYGQIGLLEAVRDALGLLRVICPPLLDPHEIGTHSLHSLQEERIGVARCLQHVLLSQIIGSFPRMTTGLVIHDAGMRGMLIQAEQVDLSFEIHVIALAIGHGHEEGDLCL